MKIKCFGTGEPVQYIIEQGDKIFCITCGRAFYADENSSFVCSYCKEYEGTNRADN